MSADDPDAIYGEDFYDPRRRVSRSYFPYIFVLFCLSPVFIALGIPTVLTLFASRQTGMIFGFEPAGFYPTLWTVASIIIGWFFLTVCINRLRAAGKSPFFLLLPGYNLYLLLFAPDK